LHGQQVFMAIRNVSSGVYWADEGDIWWETRNSVRLQQTNCESVA